MTTPCEECGKQVDLRSIHPLGGGIGCIQQNPVAVWVCPCGTERITDAAAIAEAGGTDFLEKCEEAHAELAEIKALVPKFSCGE